MKSNFILIILITSWFISCKERQASHATIPFDEETAKKEILASIEQETKCFFERNYECWATHWSHKDYAYQAWNNSDGSVGVAAGWLAIDRQAGDYIKEKKPYSSSHPIVKREPIQWKFFNDSLTYMIWKQYNADPDGKAYQASYETRLMEKSDGQWKILNVSAFWDSKNKILADSLPNNLD
jgi:hypothetical protein